MRAPKAGRDFIRGGSDTPKLDSAWLVVGAALRRDGLSESRCKAAPTVCFQCLGAVSSVAAGDEGQVERQSKIGGRRWGRGLGEFRQLVTQITRNTKNKFFAVFLLQQQALPH